MNEKKLEQFEKPEVEVIRFDENSDVITQSFEASGESMTDNGQTTPIWG